MNTYLLSYNPVDFTINGNRLLAYVRDNRNVQQYFQPWMGTYIIKSHADLQVISAGFVDFFDESQFVIAQVFTSHLNGLLDQPMWGWINYNVMPVLPGKTGKLPVKAAP